MPGTCEPAAASRVSASGPKICDGEGVVEARPRRTAAAGPPCRAAAGRRRSGSRCAAVWPWSVGAPRLVCPLCPAHCLGESPHGGERAERPRRRVRRGGPAGADGGRGGQRAGPLHGRAGRAARRRRLRGGRRGRARIALRGRRPARAGRALRRRHLRPRAGRPRPRGRRWSTRAPCSGPGRRRWSWRSTRRTCGPSSTGPACPVPPTLVVDHGPDARRRRRRVRRGPRLAAHAQGGPRRLRRQGRLAGRRPAPRPRRSWRRSTGRVVVEELRPARRRAGRHGGPAPLGRVGGLAGGRDGAGRRRVPRGARARAGWTPTSSRPPPRSGSRWPRSPAPWASWRSSSSGRAAGSWSTRWRPGPHNSGHWTIEGAVTSQFENHLRAVLDLPLGSTAPQHPQVASVNVFGGPAGEDPAGAAGPRPGRRGRPRAPVWQGRHGRDANWGT